MDGGTVVTTLAIIEYRRAEPSRLALRESGVSFAER